MESCGIKVVIEDLQRNKERKFMKINFLFFYSLMSFYATSAKYSRDA